MTNVGDILARRGLHSSRRLRAEALVSHLTDAAAPTENFAVVALSGTQYKVAVGDKVITEKLPGAEVGSTIKVEDVLLMGNANSTIIGLSLIHI